jgi:2-hydroxychromene-2-carboxylate isomerase
LCRLPSFYRPFLLTFLFPPFFKAFTKMRAGSIIAALAVASAAHAHATFQNLWVDDVDQGTKCVRAPANNSPITDLTSNVSTHISTLLLQYLISLYYD